MIGSVPDVSANPRPFIKPSKLPSVPWHLIPQHYLLLQDPRLA
jgi:hypothetical protein